MRGGGGERARRGEGKGKSRTGEPDWQPPREESECAAGAGGATAAAEEEAAAAAAAEDGVAESVNSAPLLGCGAGRSVWKSFK